MARKLRKLTKKQFKQYLEDKEKRQIEKVLGEEFETLREARKALREETKPVSMYRLTVAAPYYTRQKTGASRNSPMSSSFIVRGWFSTQRQAKAAVNRFTDKAITGRNGAVGSDRRSFSKDEDPNIEIKEVEFDKRFLDLEEEQDERVND